MMQRSSASPLLSLCLLATGMLATACGGGTEAESAAAKTSAAAPVAQPTSLPPLPLHPEAELLEIARQVDYVDFLFYNYDFSMSMDSESGVTYALQLIGPEPAQRSPACQPIGRVYYQVRGQNALTAELFFSPGCAYLQFVDGNTPLYAHSISEQGRAFLNGQFAQLIPNYRPVD